jgi:hypothetical protein
MGDLSPEQRAGEILTIRTKIRANKKLLHDLRKNLLEVLANHGIELEDEIAQDITIALPDEVTRLLVAVDLPGGSNCRIE